MTYDLFATALTAATLGLLARKAFHLLLARFEPDRPYWEALGEVSGPGCGSCPAAPVRVVAGVVDWDERGWA